jgi:hypothetical protein
MFGRTSKVDVRCTPIPFAYIFLTVAYKRFTDNVPLAIDSELVRGAEKGMLQLLYTSLEINGSDGLAFARSSHRRVPISQIGGQTC